MLGLRINYSWSSGARGGPHHGVASLGLVSKPGTLHSRPLPYPRRSKDELPGPRWQVLPAYI